MADTQHSETIEKAHNLLSKRTDRPLCSATAGEGHATFTKRTGTFTRAVLASRHRSTSQERWISSSWCSATASPVSGRSVSEAMIQPRQAHCRATFPEVPSRTSVLIPYTHDAGHRLRSTFDHPKRAVRDRQYTALVRG
jgi:hypothetical protein